MSASELICSVSAVRLTRSASSLVVEVSGRYSNPPRTPLDLAKLSSAEFRETPNSPILGRRRQVQRCLGELEVDELVEAYCGGTTVLKLAATFQIHRTTVLALLETKGVPRRGRIWSPDLTKQATRLYTEGRSCASIGRQLKVNPETVRQHLMTAGVTLRPPGQPPRRLTSL
jgi:hypothetical protein